jgi:hypothetical protein
VTAFVEIANMVLFLDTVTNLPLPYAVPCQNSEEGKVYKVQVTASVETATSVLDRPATTNLPSPYAPDTQLAEEGRVCAVHVTVSVDTDTIVVPPVGITYKPRKFLVFWAATTPKIGIYPHFSRKVERLEYYLISIFMCF